MDRIRSCARPEGDKNETKVAPSGQAESGGFLVDAELDTAPARRVNLLIPVSGLRCSRAFCFGRAAAHKEKRLVFQAGGLTSET